MRFRPLLAIVLLTSCGGCVYTTTSLGTPEDRGFDEALLGTWEEPADTFSWISARGKVTIQRKGDKAYAYEHDHPEGLRKGEFHLLKLGDSYFLEEQVAKDRFFALRVALLGDRLRYRPFLGWEVERVAKEVPKVKVTAVDRGGALVRNVDYLVEGPTKDLQEVLVKRAPLSEQYGTLRRAGAEKVTEQGLASKKQRTYELWLELPAHLSSVHRLKEISSEGADDEAVALHKEFLGAAERLQTRRQASAKGQAGKINPELRFYQGLEGKEYVSPKEDAAERAAWQEGARLREKVTKAREALEKRYGLKLP